MSDKSALSLGKTRSVCGYWIKQMPLGAYLRAMNRLENLPGDFFEACFPGKSLQEILDNLSKINDDGVKDLAIGLFKAAPKYLTALLSELSGVPEDALMDDENIGLAGFLDIADAVTEVNRLGETAARLRGLWAKLAGKKLTAIIGSKLS